MTAQAAAVRSLEAAPALRDLGDPTSLAADHIAASALHPDSRGRVGIELEFHLVDRLCPRRRPTWAEVERLLAALPPMPAGSAVTVEPGGQLELSVPPMPDLGRAVAALRTDAAALRRAVADAGFGLLALGTDPVRAPMRVNPRSRYLGMERHFDAVGCGTAARAMMSGTAALQINLDAGPATEWAARTDLLAALRPVLVALSSTSPMHAGRSSGWHSMRSGIWSGLDARRVGPIPAGDPVEAWTRYALDAPVMLLGPARAPHGVAGDVSLRRWLTEPDALGRATGLADLDLHLTTLFPGVRPRGYLELRCLDAMPDRWWPALVALVVTVMEVPRAADAAREALARAGASEARAARVGLADPAVRAGVTACLAAALEMIAPADAAELTALSDLVARGLTPADELAERIRCHGPLRLVEEEIDE